MKSLVLLSFLVIFLVVLLLGCVQQKPTEKIEEKPETEGAEKVEEIVETEEIEQLETPDEIYIPEINESEGDFPSPV